MRAFARCMREHGVDMPDPQESSGGGFQLSVPGAELDKATIDAAEKECRKLLPNGGQLGKPDAKQMEEMRKMAKCLRDHGVDAPDPDPDNPGVRVGSSGSDDPGHEKMDKAMKECMGSLPPGAATDTQPAPRSGT
jgi:hypothetical protein